jgi:hypothetical protein
MVAAPVAAANPGPGPRFSTDAGSGAGQPEAGSGAGQPDAGSGAGQAGAGQADAGQAGAASAGGSLETAPICWSGWPGKPGSFTHVR